MTHEPTHRRPRVLAIDVAEDVLKLYEALLGEEGYTVVAIPCDAAGPMAIAQMQPDLMLLDCFIGCCTTGWDVLAMIGSDPGLRRVPVVICTTDMQLVRDEAERLAGDGIRVVPKPFDIRDLLDAIAGALSTAGIAHEG